MINISHSGRILTEVLCCALIYFLSVSVPHKLFAETLIARKILRFPTIWSHPKTLFHQENGSQFYDRKSNFSAVTLIFSLSCSSTPAKLSFAANDIKNFYWILGFYVLFAYKRSIHMPFCCFAYPFSKKLHFYYEKLTFLAKGDVEMKVNFKKLQVLLINSNKNTFAIQQNCNDVEFLWVLLSSLLKTLFMR